MAGKSAVAKQWKGDAKELPRAALHFRSALKFAAADPNVKSDGDAGGSGGAGKTVPFTMTARSGDPITHWYWGRVVHDMTGMELSKPTLPVDYCHSCDEVMGFADKFDASNDGLEVSGELVPMPDDEDDRAAEVIYKQKLGVPYEASIDFSGGAPVIEYVPMDASVEVNGKQFAGPGVVIRQWTLRGLAICPYGADPDTATEFARAAREGDKVTVTAINSPKEGEQMSLTNKVEAGKTPPTAPATPATPAVPAGGTQLTDKPGETKPAEVKPQDKFVSAFGDVGARWFLEGKTFETSATEFIGQLRQTHADDLKAKQTQFDTDKTALQAQLDAANAKLAAIGRGDAGVTFSNAEGAGNVDPATAKLQENLSPGTARFAAGIKLPGQLAKK